MFWDTLKCKICNFHFFLVAENGENASFRFLLSTRNLLTVCTVRKKVFSVSLLLITRKHPLLSILSISILPCQYSQYCQYFEFFVGPRILLEFFKCQFHRILYQYLAQNLMVNALWMEWRETEFCQMPFGNQMT